MICTPAQVDSLCVIHYGSTKYEPSKVYPIKNHSLNKPRGGLWTSPLNSSHSWKDWCTREEFRECKRNESFMLKFKPDAKILIIDSYIDLEKLPVKSVNLKFRWYQIDFQRLSKKYDAIWLTENGERDTRWSDPLSLYGWDVETIFVMNNKKIYQV